MLQVVLVYLSSPVFLLVSLSVSQSMVVGPLGPVGLSVLVRVLMTSVASPSECDGVPALTPPPPVTQCRLATVALETTPKCKCVVTSPTVQVRGHLMIELI